MERISVCGNNLVKWWIGRLIEFNFTKIVLLLYQEIVRRGHSLKAVVDTHWKISKGGVPPYMEFT